MLLACERFISTAVLLVCKVVHWFMVYIVIFLELIMFENNLKVYKFLRSIGVKPSLAFRLVFK